MHGLHIFKMFLMMSLKQSPLLNNITLIIQHLHKFIIFQIVKLTHPTFLIVNNIFLYLFTLRQMILNFTLPLHITNRILTPKFTPQMLQINQFLHKRISQTFTTNYNKLIDQILNLFRK